MDTATPSPDNYGPAKSVFRHAGFWTIGAAIPEVLPPVAAHGANGATKQRVIGRLGNHFERFFGSSSHGNG